MNGQRDRDVHWQSEGAASASDRYELDVSSGAADLSLDQYTPKVSPPAAPAVSTGGGKAASALDLLLDGVEARVKAVP